MSFTEKEKGSVAESLSPEELEFANAIQELINDTNATQLINNWKIGKLVEDAYGEKNYGRAQMKKIAKYLNTAPSTLYGFKKLHERFSFENIKKLAKGKFSTPHMYLKAYGAIGQDEIMRIFNDRHVQTLDAFRDRLKKQWCEFKAGKRKAKLEPTEDIPDTPDNPDNEANADTTEKGNQIYLIRENSAASDKGQSPDPGEQPNETPHQDDDEKEDGNEDHESEPGDDQETGTAPTQSESPDPIEQTNGTPSQDDEGNQDHDETEPGDTQGAETVPALDKPKPDDGMTGDGNSDPTDGIYDVIKQEGGSAVQINKPESEEVKTPSQSLIDGHEGPGQPVDLVPIAQSELDSLQKENEDLKAEIVDLKQEISELQEEIEDLNYRLSEVNENELELEF
jgi:hypothetical protein